MSFYPHYKVDNQSIAPDERHRREQSARNKALDAAARVFSVQEYQALIHDIDNGRVDVRLSGVAGRVDQELRLVPREGRPEHVTVGIIHFGPPQVAKGYSLAGEQRLIGMADVTGTSEQVDHEAG